MAVNSILASYSPESVVVVISNDKFTHQLSGFAESTFISITRLVEHATLYNGADASNVRVVRGVKNCDVTLTLHQASESNDVLSQLLVMDETTRNGEDVFAITIKDTSGRTVASSPAAFIGTSPDIEFGVEVSERAWVIRAINLDIHAGGNGKMLASTYDTMADLGMDVDSVWSPGT